MGTAKGLRCLVPFILWLLLHSNTFAIHGVEGIRRCINEYENLSREEFFTNLIEQVPADHDGTALQLPARRDEETNLFVPGNINPSSNSNQHQQGLQWPDTVSKMVSKSSETLSKNLAEVNVKDANNNHAVLRSYPQMTTALPDSSTHEPQEQLVAISLDLLTSLIKGSRVPPSGPSKDHNWAASSTLPEQTNKNPPPNPDTIYFRIQRVDAPKSDHVGNGVPLIQDIGSSVTYRIQN